MTTADRETDAPGRGVMTKDELIERMAAELAGAWLPAGVGFADCSEESKRHYRSRAEQLLPLLVEFVAGWIKRTPHIYGFHGRINAVELWRKEMAS